MRKRQIVQLVTLLILVMVLAIACRQDEEVQPTVVSLTAETESTEGESTATAVPQTTTASGATQPTATTTAATAAAVSPDAIDWPPQVISADPLPGSEIPTDAAIALRFDQPMDQDSVEAAWNITPGIDGQFSWPRPDMVIFEPAKALEREQAYRVRVDENATSQQGLALTEAVEFELQTAGFLEVTQTIPDANAQKVQADSAITVVFNRPVVPLVSSDQQNTLPQPLTLNPAVEGRGEWVSTSIYRFVPENGLAGAVTYQATIDETLTDISGGVLSGPYSWQFSTDNPQVISVLPTNGSVLVNPSRAISVTFNMPMERGSTETAVGLTPGAAVSPSWENEDRVLILTPDNLLDLETIYELSIGSGARSANGEAGLAKPFSSRFTTIPFPAVIETQPADGALADTWQNGVGIQFTSPMDMDTLQDRIQISPAPAKDPNYFYNEYIDPENPANSSVNLYLDFPLARNSEYTITVPADAADPYGNTLGADYTWRFTTPGYTPVASFNLPAQLSQLSTSFPTDVDVLHRNVSRLDVTLADAGLPITLLSDIYLIDEFKGATLRTWNIDLDTPQDEAAATTISLANGDVLPTGFYVISVSAPELDPETRYWQNRNNLLIVADTNLVVKEMPNEVRVWATDLESGRAAEGRSLTLYSRTGAELGTAVTDNNGFARFDYAPIDNYLNGVVVISNAPGEAGFGAGSSNWSGDVSPWRMGINYGYSLPLPEFAYIYTDRPIYRPGDTMYFKGILREADFGRYALPEPRTMNLQITTNFYSEEGGLDVAIPVEVNADGIFFGEYVLPEDVTLGSYNLFLPDQDYSTSRTFTVAEYRKPEFQVLMTSDKDEAVRGEPVNVTLAAEYFFGGTPAGLNVNWSIYEDIFWPEIDGPPYSFGDQAGFNFVDTGPFGGLGSGSGVYGSYVTGGSGVLDENGRITITLPADLLKDVEEGSRKVTVEASVVDISNFPVTSNTSVVFHAADVYVGVRPAEYGPTAGSETDVEIITVDWDGAVVANQNVEVVIYEREWKSSRDASYGMYYTAWEPVDTEVARLNTTTDDQGKGSVSFTPANGGSYIAAAAVTDGSGRSHTSTTSIWVIDENFAGWRTDPKIRTMELVPEKTDLQVGETARILVQSPFAGQVQAWLTIERGNLIDQQVVTLDGGSTVLEIPISPAYAPNVFVSVTAIKPATHDDEAAPYADIRLGITELQVDPQQFDLNLDMTPRETFFEPGETAVYDILITDNSGNPVVADFSLALVDLAVLNLKEDNAPPIMEAFYSPQPYLSQVGSGLFVSGEGLEPEIPLEGGGGGGGGGGDIAQEAVARLEEEEDVRRDFPDTAYWEASVQTGGDGRAEVEIPLPDSLTTWRLSSKAVTTDTHVGQNNTDVIVSLPLLVRPVTPRFFTVGDVVQIGAIANNNTASDIETTLSLEGSGFVESALEPQTVNVPAGGQRLVRWEVTVDDLPYADLTFRVEGGDYSDATKPPLGIGDNNLIPIYRYDAPDVAGTAGELDAAGRQVEALLLPPQVDTRRGAVDIKLNPSLAAAVLDGLEAVADSDIEPLCAHAVADRLLPNAVMFEAIKTLELETPQLAAELETLIPQDVDRLENLQKENGGWGWCGTPKSDPWLSAYAILALAKAQQAGFDANSEIFEDGLTYIERQLEDVEDLDTASAANRQAFFLYVLAEGGTFVDSDVDELVDAHRGLLDPYAKALLALAYELNNAKGANQQTLINDLNAEAVFSATGAHWEDADNDMGNLSSTVRGTAMVIKTLARVQPDTTVLPAAVRWLMVARTVDVWPTMHETAWSLMGLTEWMTVSGELDANYDYQVNINTTPLTDGRFTADNLTDSQSLSIPVNNLLVDEANFFDFQRGEGDGRFYYTMHLNSAVPVETVGPSSRGLTIERAYYAADCDPETQTCEPIDRIQAGEQVRVELNIIAPNDLVYAVVEDPIPAGAQGIDPGLATSASGFEGGIDRVEEDFRYGYWGWWYFNQIEYRDEKVVFLSDYLPAGTYQYTYFLDANIPGDYQVMPAFGYQEFFPEVNGRSEGFLFTIEE